MTPGVVQIAILSPTAPPTTGPVETLIYHHASLLDAAGYGLRIVAGSGNEAYYEVSFDHRVEFFWIPELNPAYELESAGLAGELLGGFVVQRDHLVDHLRPLLSGADLWFIYDALTSPRSLPLAAAIHILAQERAVRLVAWVHASDSAELDGLPAGYPGDLLRTSWPGVTYVAASQDLSASFAVQRGIPAEQIRVIPSGIDAAALFGWGPVTRRLIDRLHLLDSDLLVLHPGPVAQQANIELALRVTAVLKERFPGVRLLVAGRSEHDQLASVEDLPPLRSLADALGLKDHVHFLCPHCEQDLPLELVGEEWAGLYGLADLLFFPNLEDTDLDPLLAAGLARMPVFAANNPAAQRLLAGQSGLFRVDGDPQSIAAAMIAWLQSDPAFTLRRRILDGYTWDAIFTRYIRPLVEGET